MTSTVELEYVWIELLMRIDQNC